MAEILVTWLNDEVGLSKKVTSFEKDFASGYLFGELLFKFNQQNDFELFSSKDIYSHRVKNFEKLEPTLRNLNVKFDSIIVDKIMKGERGCALRLLYQLKMILEKVYPMTDIAVLTQTGQFGDNQPALKIAKPKDKFDKIQHEFFIQRLAALNKPQKQINMDRHLEKFTAEQERQTKFAADGTDADKQAANQRKQDLRRIQINKLQRNAGFMEEWQQKGVEDWKKNQKKKKEREMEDLEFEFKQAQKFNSLAVKKLDNAHVEVYDGIAKFEQTLKDKGINPTVSKDLADTAVAQSFKNTPIGQTQKIAAKLQGKTATMLTQNGAFTLTSTGLKQRTKKVLTDATRLQREKRRRRLIGQQDELMVELEQKQREAMVVELMKRQAAQEKELDYEVWRTSTCKNIICENRNLRENQYMKRRQLDMELAEAKEIQILTQQQEQTHRLVEEKCSRDVEMRQYEQDAKLKAHTELCAGLVNKIFDIADEAYKHQQKMDSKDIDPRNWHEWLQLFVNEKEIANTHERLTQLATEETAGSSVTKLETDEDPANAKLDELEMIDYIKNEGQWNKELVSKNKPNLESIINPPAEQVVTGKKGAPVKGGQAQQEVQFDADDLEIKDQPDNNFLLGDAIEQIIKLNYEDRAKLKHPQTPHWLPLKLSLVGYPFAGKKFQANMIKEKYGLDVFIMDDLIQEAIQFFRDHPFNIEMATAINVTRGGSVMSGVQTDGEVLSEDEEGEINAAEDFRQLGKEIEELLLSGQEIRDDLYVNLFVTKLRIQYEYKDPQTQRAEIHFAAKKQVDLQKRILQIDEELEQEGLNKKRVKQLEADKALLITELAKFSEIKTQGWVLVDFPCSYSQAKLLEKALSGFEPDEELELTERQKQLKGALLLAQPNPKPQPPQTLIPSGLDAVIWFDCGINECIRRADGRRVDIEDDQESPLIYHIEDKKPPTDQAPLCERLDHIKDDSNGTESLIDRYVSFDQTTKSMKTWLTKFGVESDQQSLLTIIDANLHQDQVQDQISTVIRTVLQLKTSKINNARELIAFRIRQVLDERARINKEEEERIKMAELIERSGTPSHKSEKPLDLLKTGEAIKTGMETSKNVSRDLNNTSQREMLGMTQSQMTQVTQPSDRERIDNDFKPVIMQLWQELSNNYKRQMKKIFKNFRLHREQVVTRRSDILKKFLDFLHNADNKQAILDDFVQNFNQFSNEYPDLREDDQTKEELHQRTDVFSDELWEIVEERKEQAVEFRKQVMESGTVESSQAFITSVAQQLMQAELDKFKISVQILQDYYHAIEEKLIPEAAQTVTVELGFDDGDAPLVESLPEGADQTNGDLYTYPRLDKLLLLALKQQIIVDVAAQNAAIDPKSKNAPKGKAPPAKGSVQQEEDKQAEESQYAKELREALKVEKGILRYRLVQVRNWALKNLRDSRKDFIMMYKKLEDWIFVAQRAEMEAIDQMCIVIKSHIESEQKIKAELRINFMDFTVDKKTLNFITPPPPPLEALEEYREDRFSIAQLNFLKSEFDQFEASCITRENFPVKSVAELFISKKNASIGFGGYLSALPLDWNKLSQTQLRLLVLNLDHECTGFIAWKVMLTYFALLQSPIASEKDIQNIKQQCKSQNGLVSHANFLNTPVWFDNSERSHDRKNAEVFERVRLIKDILFKSHSRIVPGYDDPMLDINQLCDVFTTPNRHHPKSTFKTYYEFLFAPIKPAQQ